VSEQGSVTRPNSVSRGAFTTLAGQLIRFALQFLGLVFLARLLSPQDYGLIAMVTAVIGVGEVFRDFGLSSAAVQSETLSVSQRSNLFWVNTAVGGILTLVCFLCATPIADFYGRPSLVVIVQALAVTFLVNGMSTQYRASLNRALSFGRLAACDTLAQGLALCVAVALAVVGAGIWSLVAQQVVQSTALLVLLVTLGGWLPQRYDRSASVGSQLRFGWYLMATQLLGYVSRNVDNVIIGQRFGAGPLGVYSRAYQLLLLPLNQLNAPSTTVALPLLSRSRSDPELFNRRLLRGQSIMVTLVCCVFGFAGGQASQIVDVLFGPQWAGVAPIFAVLSFAGGFQAVSYATYWVFLSRAMTASNLLFSSISRAVVILALFAGAQWGPLGVATGYAISLGLVWPLGILWVTKVAEAPGVAMFVAGARAYALGLGGGLVAMVVSRAVDGAPIAQLLAGGVAFLLYLLTLCCGVPAIRRDLLSVWEMFRSVADPDKEVR
jgi:PST family polysaccharide transporter